MRQKKEVSPRSKLVPPIQNRGEMINHPAAQIQLNIETKTNQCDNEHFRTWMNDERTSTWKRCPCEMKSRSVPDLYFNWIGLYFMIFYFFLLSTYNNNNEQRRPTSTTNKKKIKEQRRRMTIILILTDNQRSLHIAIRSDFVGISWNKYNKIYI